MDYTKTKLIPLALYRRLMEAEDNKVDNVSTKPPKIMKAPLLADDAKILLYSDAVRDLNAKLAQRRKMPIFMEEKQTKVDRTSRQFNNHPKAIAIYQHLRQHGISQNDEGEVVVQGNVVPDSHLPTVIRALMNVHLGKVPGLHEVLFSLPNAHPDFSPAVLRKYGPPHLVPHNPSSHRTPSPPPQHVPPPPPRPTTPPPQSTPKSSKTKNKKTAKSTPSHTSGRNKKRQQTPQVGVGKNPFMKLMKPIFKTNKGNVAKKKKQVGSGKRWFS